MTAKTKSTKNIQKSTKKPAHKFDADTNAIVQSIRSTTSPATLSLAVKAVIYARDKHLGYDVEAPTFKFERVLGAAAQERAKALCGKIMKMSDGKAIAHVFKMAVKARAEARSAAAKKAGASA